MSGVFPARGTAGRASGGAARAGPARRRAGWPRRTARPGPAAPAPCRAAGRPTPPTRTSTRTSEYIAVSRLLCKGLLP